MWTLVNRCELLTAQWPWVPSIGQNLKPFNGYKDVSIWLKFSSGTIHTKQAYKRNQFFFQDFSHLHMSMYSYIVPRVKTGSSLISQLINYLNQRINFIHDLMLCILFFSKWFKLIQFSWHGEIRIKNKNSSKYIHNIRKNSFDDFVIDYTIFVALFNSMGFFKVMYT